MTNKNLKLIITHKKRINKREHSRYPPSLPALLLRKSNVKWFLRGGKNRYYHTLYFSLARTRNSARNLQLILKISATYRLVSYLPADN